MDFPASIAVSTSAANQNGQSLSRTHKNEEARTQLTKFHERSIEHTLRTEEDKNVGLANPVLHATGDRDRTDEDECVICAKDSTLPLSQVVRVHVELQQCIE